MDAVYGETAYGSFAVVYDRTVTFFEKKTAGKPPHTRELDRAVHWADGDPEAGSLQQAFEDAQSWRKS